MLIAREGGREGRLGHDEQQPNCHSGVPFAGIQESME